MEPILTTHQPAPDFYLPDLNGNIRHLKEFRGRIVILNFWSPECPWVERADSGIMDLLAEQPGRLAYLPVDSNMHEDLDTAARIASSRGIALLLVDAEQKVADLYGAQNTPHIFVVDGDGILRYQGAYDDVTFRNRTATRNYLREAVQALLKGSLPDPDQTPPYGCTIVRHIA